MAIVIDSNVFIAAERSKGKGRLGELLSQIPTVYQDHSAVMSVVTASELIHGIHRAQAESVRRRRADFVDEILDRFPELPIDLHVAQIHGGVTAYLRSRGISIGVNDSWIAATALSFDFPLATSNMDEFSRIPELVVIPIEL